MTLDAALHRAQIDDLADQIALCAARIDAALHELLTHLRRFEELRGWARQGCKSCAHWLSWRVGLGMVAARERVRVAMALGRLPRIDAALSRGELSYAKVRAATRVATAANEDLLLDQARGTTGAELERICSRYRALAPGVALDPERRFVRRRALSDGLVQIELRLLPDEAERVWQALGEARRRLEPEPGGASAESSGQGEGMPDMLDERQAESAERSPRPTLADAAVAMVEASLRGWAAGAGSAAAAERRMLVVHVDRQRETAELEDGTGLAEATLRRLACDARLVEARAGEHGEVVGLGHLRRTVSPVLARALRARDRGCTFPGCGSAAFVDAHHIEHWASGGATTMQNLVLVCHAHHVALHEGGFSVERAGGQLVYRDPEGRLIERAPRPPRVEGTPKAWQATREAAGGARVDVSAGLVRRPFFGIDLDGCVRALAGREQ